MRAIAGVITLSLVLANCKHVDQKSLPKVNPVDRKVIGQGQPYSGLRGLDAKALASSMRYRREQAWNIVAAVLREVPIAQGQGLEGFQPVGEKSLPLWQTWYDQAEFREVFKALYGSSGPASRRQSQDFCPDALATALKTHAEKNLHVRIRGDRFENRLKQFKNVDQIRGISGRGITFFSPGILLHYLMNYQIVSRCRQERGLYTRETPPPSEDNFAPCLKAEFPSLNSWSKHVSALDFSHCKSQGLSASDLSQRLEEEGGVAAAIKTSWTRVSPGQDISHFNFDTASIEKAFAAGEWKPNGVSASVDLQPEQIYTIETIPDSAEDPRIRYQLTAMHIMTKDVRDWMWISLIWSPEPDTDLGADRPSYLSQLKPWNNYKMCVTSGFNENDPNPGEGFQGDIPDLAASLNKIHSLTGPHTFCSNPFIERGKGNGRTNCIGCHQHARTGVGQDEIYLDDQDVPGNEERRRKYPNSARSKLRSNFPSDYLWSFFEDDIIDIVESYKLQDSE
jgi:hypothetical protein